MSLPTDSRPRYRLNTPRVAGVGLWLVLLAWFLVDPQLTWPASYAALAVAVIAALLLADAPPRRSR